MTQSSYTLFQKQVTPIAGRENAVENKGGDLWEDHAVVWRERGTGWKETARKLSDFQDGTDKHYTNGQPFSELGAWRIKLPC